MDDTRAQEWTLKRNCCLTPRQFALSYVVLCALSCLAGLMCMLHGIWHVLAFTLLEMIGVAIAFLHYARHATDHEHIELKDDCLLIEHVQAGKTRQIRLDPARTRIALPRRSQDLILLEARGVKTDVGRYLTQTRRRQFAQELQRQLRSRSPMRAVF